MNESLRSDQQPVRSSEQLLSSNTDRRIGLMPQPNNGTEEIVNNSVTQEAAHPDRVGINVLKKRMARAAILRDMRRR